MIKKHLKRWSFLCIALAVFFAWGTGLASNRDLTVSMAFLPDILESPDKGVFADLVKAIDDVYDGNIKRKVYPMARSTDNVMTGKADFHLPMIRNKVVPVDSLPYAYTTEKMGDVVFVIYSHKDNPITYEKIQQAKNTKPFPIKVESIRGFADYFDFPISESSALDSSLRKVDMKRVDAFIFAQEESGFTLKQLKLKNVHRDKYDSFDDVFVIPKGAKGKEIDEILSQCIVKLRDSGKLQKLHRKVHLPYQGWQP
ncbi:MAG: ABC transporter substrate-binding protein [Deltaproteobacteria bacterium]|nr:ABC transporter substrate-binding protein [Deltaproteobacteria bacterium]